MATPGFPLPLRNALAELALASHEDAGACAALAWLAGRPGGEISPAAAERLVALHLIDPGGQRLLDVHAPHEAAAAAHAARALCAARALESMPKSDGVTRAVHRAAALWKEGLFFEVHEVLEAEWQHASGDLRQALQGVIQIAVAYHHLMHGNRRGARSLLAEGRRRLAGLGAQALELVDLGALLEATAPWETVLAAEAATPLHPPELPLRTRS